MLICSFSLACLVSLRSYLSTHSWRYPFVCWQVQTAWAFCYFFLTIVNKLSVSPVHPSSFRMCHTRCRPMIGRSLLISNANIFLFNSRWHRVHVSVPCSSVDIQEENNTKTQTVMWRKQLYLTGLPVCITTPTRWHYLHKPGQLAIFVIAFRVYVLNVHKIKHQWFDERMDTCSVSSEHVVQGMNKRM